MESVGASKVDICCQREQGNSHSEKKAPELLSLLHISRRKQERFDSGSFKKKRRSHCMMTACYHKDFVNTHLKTPKLKIERSQTCHGNHLGLVLNQNGCYKIKAILHWPENWTKAKWLKWIIHSFNQNLLSTRTYFNEKWKTSVQAKIYKQIYNNTYFFLRKAPPNRMYKYQVWQEKKHGNSQPFISFNQNHKHYTAKIVSTWQNYSNLCVAWIVLQVFGFITWLQPKVFTWAAAKKTADKLFWEWDFRSVLVCTELHFCICGATFDG